MKKTMNDYRNSANIFQEKKGEIKIQNINLLSELPTDENFIKKIKSGGIKIRKRQSTITNPDSYLFTFNYRKENHYGIYENGQYKFGDFEHLLLKNSPVKEDETKPLTGTDIYQ